MKFLSPRIHGFIDYGAVLVLALAPTLFGFAGIAALLCYVLAVVQLGMSLATAYPLGLAHLIPFTAHGGVELVTSFFLVAAPWLFGFADVTAARNFFVIGGIVLLATYLITNYRAADAYRRSAGSHRTQSSFG